MVAPEAELTSGAIALSAGRLIWTIRPELR